jgi:hypothetical protein
MSIDFADGENIMDRWLAPVRHAHGAPLPLVSQHLVADNIAAAARDGAHDIFVMGDAQLFLDPDFYDAAMGGVSASDWQLHDGPARERINLFVLMIAYVALVQVRC